LQLEKGKARECGSVTWENKIRGAGPGTEPRTKNGLRPFYRVSEGEVRREGGTGVN